MPLMRLQAGPWLLLPLLACGDTTASDTGSGTGTGTSSDTGTDTGTTGDVPTTDAPTTTGTSTGPTPTTDATSTGSTDTGETACATLICGVLGTCCAADAACVHDECAPACPGGVRCGAARDVCCDDGEVCLEGACVAPLGACADDLDCEGSDFCDPALGQCLPLPPGNECDLVPDDPGPLAVELEWSFEADEVVGLPMIADLDADGANEVVFTTTRKTGVPTDYPIGEIVALDAATGAELWRIPHDPINAKFGAQGRATIGVADVSGDAQPDVIYAGRQEGMNKISPVHAVDGAGKLLWTSRNLDDTVARVRIENGAPALANLDDDPQAEIAFGAAIFDHDGLMVWNQDGNGAVIGSPHNKGQPNMLLYPGGLSTFVDLTGDGKPELLTGNRAWTIDWVPGAPPTVTLKMLWQDTAGQGGDGWPSVADLDDDGSPEVVLVAWPEIHVLDGATGELWCGIDPTGVACEGNDDKRTQPILVPGGNLGGPAVITDFDGDGRPEFGLSTGSEFILFDLNREGEQVVKPANVPPPLAGAIYPRWAVKIQDKSSASTGASAFDFDADGSAEVLTQDECFTRVLDGRTGAVRLELANSSGAIHEYPLALDLDLDDDTELLTVANFSDAPLADQCAAANPGWQTRRGVFVYHTAAGPWPPTGHLWTMHTYHVTNVDGLGNVPASEQAHWEIPSLNNFRRGLQGDLPGVAPDLDIGLAADLGGCPGTITLQATVHNAGTIGVPAGIDVVFFAGADADAPQLGAVPTAEPLAPGATTIVTWPLSPPEPGAQVYFAVVDPDNAVGECREDNNSAPLTGAVCPP